MGIWTTCNISTDSYPLTSRQQDPDGTQRAPEHVITVALRITGALDVDALGEALDEVVHSHEALRTHVCYDPADGTLGHQHTLDPMAVPFTVEDAPLAPGKARDDMARDLHVAAAAQILPHDEPPAIRARLVRFDAQDAVLTLVTHHLFSDQWSNEIILRDLTACYRNRLQQQPPPRPASCQQRDYVEWEEQFLSSPAADNARTYWAKTLTDSHMFTLPADRSHGAHTRAPLSLIARVVIEDVTPAIEAAKRSRCTMWHLILATTMVLAHTARGTRDITLLTVSHGRPTPDFFDAVGLFANLVPLRLNFSDCTTFRDLMLRAREASLRAQKHDIDFGSIVQQSPQIMSSFEDSWSIPVALNFTQPVSTSTIAGLTDQVEPVLIADDLPTLYHRGSCMWSAAQTNDGEIHLTVEYEPDMIDTATIGRWQSLFASTIKAIGENPDQAWLAQ